MSVACALILPNFMNYREAEQPGARAANALLASLSGFNTQLTTNSPWLTRQPVYSSSQYGNQHYYMQTSLRQTTEGYSYSSAYNPYSNHQAPLTPLPEPTSDAPAPQYNRSASAYPNPHNKNAISGSWFTPGSSRCTFTGCKFQASAKSVEVHMMDRHLIYPKNWDPKEEKSWDGDLDMKGKPVPVAGTSLLLDTPEALEMWLNERRKKWPTGQRIVEKRRRKEEAIDRGEIQMEDLRKRTKRQRSDFAADCNRGVARRNNRGGITRKANPVQRRPAEPQRAPTSNQLNDSGDGTDSDSSPEEVSNAKQATPSQSLTANAPDTTATLTALSNTPHDERCQPRYPRQQKLLPSTNQRKGVVAGEGRSLLLNVWIRVPQSRKALTFDLQLLLPEIRHTVSELSQAIHFMVENSFFDNFELKPGDGDAMAIQVIPDAVEGKGECDERDHIMAKCPHPQK